MTSRYKYQRLADLNFKLIAPRPLTDPLPAFYFIYFIYLFIYLFLLSQVSEPFRTPFLKGSRLHLVLLVFTLKQQNQDHTLPDSLLLVLPIFRHGTEIKKNIYISIDVCYDHS